MSQPIQDTSVYTHLPYLRDLQLILAGIACDGETKSEIVIPLRILGSSEPIGVLDLDSTALRIFDDDDLAGLQQVVDILIEACDWT